MLRTAVVVLFVACSVAHGATLFMKPSAGLSADIHSVAKAIKASTSLSTAEKRHHLSSLKTMNDEVKRFNTVSSSERKELEEDVRGRFQEIRELVQTKTPSRLISSKQVQKDESRIDADVAAVRHTVETMSVPSEEKRKLEENLDAIDSDSKKFASAKKDEKLRLKQAIEYRMSALKLQLEEVSSPESAPQNVKPLVHNTQLEETNVEKDIAKLEGYQSMSEEAKDNLDQLKQDSRNYAAATTGKERTRLKKAIHDRLDLFKLQLEAEHLERPHKTKTPAFAAVTQEDSDDVAENYVSSDDVADNEDNEDNDNDDVENKADEGESEDSD